MVVDSGGSAPQTSRIMTRRVSKEMLFCAVRLSIAEKIGGSRIQEQKVSSKILHRSVMADTIVEFLTTIIWKAPFLTPLMMCRHLSGSGSINAPGKSEHILDVGGAHFFGSLELEHQLLLCLR